MKLLRKILLGLLVFLAVVIIGFLMWTTLGARTATERAIQSLADHNVVREDGLLVFQPESQPTAAPTTALIYYPGGLVEPEAYAVTAQGIADAGYLVVIPKMPLNLAVMDANRADGIIESFLEIESWVIGGHSLGGAMAATYAINNLERLDGLILFASYPANSADFVPPPLPLLTIYGSEETGAPNMQAFYELVSDSAERHVIEGGNHAQFGDYGLQGGDGTATIRPVEQQQQIVEATVRFLQSLE